MKRSKIFGQLSIIAGFMLVGSLTDTQAAQAITLTNDDFLNPPTVTLPTGWTQENIDLLFDGNTENSNSGGRVRFRPNQGGSPLSSTNFISIAVELDGLFDIDSFQIANDFGGVSSQEITDIEVIFFRGTTNLGGFEANGIDDNNANDIDDIFTNLNLSGVDEIEFRITGNEDTNRPIEIREFIVSGTPVAEPIPEPFTILGSLSAMGAGVAMKKKFKATRKN